MPKISRRYLEHTHTHKTHAYIISNNCLKRHLRLHYVRHCKNHFSSKVLGLWHPFPERILHINLINCLYNHILRVTLKSLLPLICHRLQSPSYITLVQNIVCLGLQPQPCNRTPSNILTELICNSDIFHHLIYRR